MLEASTAAGLAIDRGATGIAHGLGHALGSLVSVPHGLAVGLALREAAGFNAESDDPRCGEVAEVLGFKGYARAVSWLTEVTHLETWLATFRHQRVDAGLLADMAGSPENWPMCANNVRVPDQDDLRQLADRIAIAWNQT